MISLALSPVTVSFLSSVSLMMLVNLNCSSPLPWSFDSVTTRSIVFRLLCLLDSPSTSSSMRLKHYDWSKTVGLLRSEIDSNEDELGLSLLGVVVILSPLGVIPDTRVLREPTLASNLSNSFCCVSAISTRGVCSFSSRYLSTPKSWGVTFARACALNLRS